MLAADKIIQKHDYLSVSNNNTSAVYVCGKFETFYRQFNSGLKLNTQFFFACNSIERYMQWCFRCVQLNQLNRKPRSQCYNRISLCEKCSHWIQKRKRSPADRFREWAKWRQLHGVYVSIHWIQSDVQAEIDHFVVHMLSLHVCLWISVVNAIYSRHVSIVFT